MSFEADRALERLARDQCGLATWGQARDDCGVPDATVAWRIRHHVYGEPRPAVISLPGVVMNHVTRTMAAVLWAGDGALACCATAAALHRLGDHTFPGQVHVLVPVRRRKRLPGLVVHRSDQVTDDDRCRVGAVPATSPTRTIVDLAAALDDAALEMLILEAVRRGLTTFAKLEASARRLKNAKGTKRLRATLAIYDPTDVARLASIIESTFLTIIARSGLPRPEVNVNVGIRDGQQVVRVDFRWAGARLTVEVDGLRFHSTRAQKRYDDIRQNGLVLIGERVLRYDLYALRHERDRVVAEVRDLLTPRLAV